MSVGLLKFVDGKPSDYTKYTFLNFNNWRSMQKFAEYIKQTYPSSIVDNANAQYIDFVNQKIASGRTDSYGLNGKHPQTYEEAMSRKNFIYYEEYKEVKDRIEKKVFEELAKNSIANVLKPKFVYNEKQIGEFIFDKAAMSLLPEIYIYSKTKKRVINVETEKVVYEGDKMFLESDGSEVIYAFKLLTQEGDEYIEVNGDVSLEEASKRGVVVSNSSNKKVFLYKEKLPKTINAIKIIVALTAGGFTFWKNDFYTGATAAVIMEVLESLGYSVSIEVVMGGGRCRSCGLKLNFDGNLTHGRRFFGFTAKDFDEQVDKDGLLYTICDPSFHNIKFMSYLNAFFNFYGDGISTYGDPSGTWHGVEKEDLENPIGILYKYQDYLKGDENMLHFYIHQIRNLQESIQAVTTIALECENQNIKILQKYKNYDFSNIL